MSTAPAPPPDCELAGALRAWLEARTPQMLERILELARLESPTSDVAAQEPVFARLAEALEGLGLRTRRLRGRRGRATGGALLARSRRPGRPRAPDRRPGPGNGVQLLMGHVDTVWPRGQLASMPLRNDGERLHGPGVYDMKGGLVQMLFALEALQALGLEPALEPAVLLNADEEIGSPETTRLVARVARCVARVFVVEPSLGPEGHAKTARKAVGRFTVTVKGRAAHAGLDPDAGASAIHALARLILELEDCADRERGISLNVGQIAGGIGANVIAPEATARLETRVLTRGDAERIEKRLRGLAPPLPGTRIEIEGGFAKAPLEATPRNQALFREAQRRAGWLGFELGEGTAGGASDGNTTSLHAATLDGLGAVGGGAHAPHEFLEIGRLAERSALLALLLLSPAQPTDPGSDS